MTEDGRSTGMAALCGRSLNLLRGWGHQDAQLDANTNSLWLLVLAWGMRFRTFQLCFFRGDFS